MTLMIPLVRLLLVVLPVPVSSPLSLVRIKMALAIDLVVRVITVFVRRWRETTCVVRWSAIRTFVRHVAPAASASLTSRPTSCSAFFVAFFCRVF